VRDSYRKEEKIHKRGRKMATKELRIRQKEEIRENAEITAYYMPTYKHAVSCKKLCSNLMF
jgi:hypothetical protein